LQKEMGFRMNSPPFLNPKSEISIPKLYLPGLLQGRIGVLIGAEA
jgi:hypothetical protein